MSSVDDARAWLHGDLERDPRELIRALLRQAETLEIIALATAGGLERAGFEHVDNPGLAIDSLRVDRDAAIAQVERLTALLNTPELHDFARAVVLEASHQRERWGTDHDAGKEPQDWFWLVGYLGGKALRAHLDGNVDKALHHTISSAAALANWHAAITGQHTGMRPGIDGEAALAQQGAG
jgi:hypothetical protein